MIKLKNKKLVVITLAALMISAFAFTAFAIYPAPVNIFGLAKDFGLPANHDFGGFSVSSPAAIGDLVTVNLVPATIYGSTGYVADAYEVDDPNNTLVAWNSDYTAGTLTFTSNPGDTKIDDYYYHPIANVDVVMTSGPVPVHQTLLVAWIQYQLAPEPETTTEPAE
jgi:hypothetical protein